LDGDARREELEGPEKSSLALIQVLRNSPGLSEVEMF
jgi:hypothetical protein